MLSSIVSCTRVVRVRARDRGCAAASEPEDLAPGQQRVDERVDVRRARCRRRRDARAVAPTPRQRISGCAQWCPARMHTPPRSTSSATSCGWMPSIVNDASAAAALGLGRADDAQAGHLGEALEHVRGQRALVRAHALHPERRRGSRRPRRARRPRRSAACPPRTCTAARSSVTDWKSTEAIMSPPVRNGSICSSISRAPVQHADAGRARAPCGRSSVEVGAERRDVDRHLRHRLRAVDERQRAGGARCARSSRRPG